MHMESHDKKTRGAIPKVEGILHVSHLYFIGTEDNKYM
jgi:hypothetical protein